MHFEKVAVGLKYGTGLAIGREGDCRHFAGRDYELAFAEDGPAVVRRGGKGCEVYVGAGVKRTWSVEMQRVKRMGQVGS